MQGEDLFFYGGIIAFIIQFIINTGMHHTNPKFALHTYLHPQSALYLRQKVEETPSIKSKFNQLQTIIAE